MMEETKIDIEEVIHNSHLRKAWQRIGVRHHHGINIPLFSIHSKDSCGIGEFLDLKLLIDFCKKVGMGVIQLLPLNDAGYETSPYNAVSSQALGPIYISLSKLPFVQGDEELQLELTRFKRYTYLKKVAYNAVLLAKIEFLEIYYKKYFSNFKRCVTYKAFLKENPWVYDYGLFKVLKDDYAHKGWFSWEKADQEMTPSHRKKLIKKRKHEINFYIFLQFLAFTQMEEVKGYAENNNVLLKGDIPILISPESLDVWHHRDTFDLTYSAGSPPDMFTPDGQNWGFPIYNWPAIEKSNFAFWENRLQTADLFYHIYRIDHIIGLYRIFAIPRKNNNNKGEFIPGGKVLPLHQGEHILEKFSKICKMFPIGEDLGADIEYIRESLKKQGLPGTIIPRWQRNHFTDHSFIPYNEYSPFSVTTLSTHDSETLELWWKNNTEEVRHYCEAHGINYQEELSFEIRLKLLKDSHHTSSLFHINLLSEYLALYPDLVWENPEDERINLPGTVLPSNWCYKMRPSLEDILRHDDLKTSIKDIIQNE